jgi:hypothetical protein
MFMIILFSLVTTTFTLVSCGLFQPSYQSEEANSSFRDTIEIPIRPDIHLLTEKKYYQRKDYIGLWVENTSNHVLFFEDQSLGVEGYQYDEKSKTWHLVDLGVKVGDPRITVVKPSPHSPLPSISLRVEWIKASGPLRLLITGVTDQGEQFAAYKDIDIAD